MSILKLKIVYISVGQIFICFQDDNMTFGVESPLGELSTFLAKIRRL